MVVVVAIVDLLRKNLKLINLNCRIMVKIAAKRYLHTSKADVLIARASIDPALCVS